MLNESIRYCEGALCCDEVSLAALADEVGTPAYVYSARRVLANAARLRAAFAPLGAELHYSVKANGSLALLRLLHEAGLGMDTVGAGEIERSRRAGVPPERIVFAGVGKTRAELLYALDAGVGWFNVESEGELALLDSLAAARAVSPQVALRLNPDVRAATHPHIATGHGGAKFGMPGDVIARLLGERADFPHLRIAGFHVHIGSQLGRVDETLAAVHAAQTLAAPYPDLRTLNLGGGFPVAYASADEYPRPEAFAHALAPLLDGWRVLLEPGRSLIADAGVLLVTALYVKQQGGVRFVITDGSMTDLLRPALYGARHPIVPLREPTGETSSAVVAGPVCESADVLNPDTALPPLAPGDRLAVLGAGAYGMVMASNYNGRTRPPEVLVEGASWRLTRRRETWDDLLRLESL